MPSRPQLPTPTDALKTLLRSTLSPNEKVCFERKKEKEKGERRLTATGDRVLRTPITAPFHAPKNHHLPSKLARHLVNGVEFYVAMDHAGLRNCYWVLRHGRSIPNEAGLIISHMSNGVLPMYGLAPSGLLQAEGAGALFLKELEIAGISIDRVRIFASPFRRTLETAEAVVNSMNVVAHTKPPIKYLEGLKERYFGPSLELQSHEHYPEIWAIDAIDPLVGPEGGESVADVAIRVSEAIVQMETEMQGGAVLVVSHGDTLQILQTVVHAALATMSSADSGTLGPHLADAISRSVLSQHREYALLTGELRRLA